MCFIYIVSQSGGTFMKLWRWRDIVAVKYWKCLHNVSFVHRWMYSK
jgi:hypothetical protein